MHESLQENDSHSNGPTNKVQRKYTGTNEEVLISLLPKQAVSMGGREREPDKITVRQ